jgi:CelD/BcsL family acetyltransferase involved in cellulose biosynthesis
MNNMDITMSRTSEPACSPVVLQADEEVRATTGQRVRVVEGFAELSAQERTAWTSIAAQQTVAVPFQSLFWHETWWKHFGGSSQLGEKKLQIFIVASDGEIIAFFPMFRQSFRAGGLQLLRYIQPLGRDSNLTELRTGIVRAGFESEAYTTLVEYFQSVDLDWEVISLPAGPSQVSELYDANSVEHPAIPINEGFFIPLAPDWDSFRSGLKRNIKESIRKCYNSFKRDGIELEFCCLSDSKAIHEMLPEFYRLHSMRSAQEVGNSHRDTFETEHARRFLDLLANDPTASGLRLFLLKHEDRLIAARLGFETAHGTYLYYSGYDLDYGKYSVMTRLVIEVIKHAIASGQKGVHLSFGRDVSKTRWSPEETVYKWNLMFQKSLRGKAAALVLTSLMRLKRRGYTPDNTRREDKSAAGSELNAQGV